MTYRIMTDEDEMAAFNKACDLEQRRLGLTVREELMLICDYIIEEYAICGCGNLKRNCDCPPVDPRTELYDDPARSAR